MTNSSFENWASSVRGWPWNVVGLLICVALLIIACGLFYEDFTTSLEGYRMWPTAKANAWVVILVAALPQLGQLGAGYAFLDRKIPALFIVLMLFMAWDMFMDVYYKSYAFQTVELSLAAVFESILLYSLGSELLLAFAAGMIFRIAPSVFSSIGGSKRRRVSSRHKVPPPTYNPTPTPPSQKVKVPKL